jgi:hypothetical protein
MVMASAKRAVLEDAPTRLCIGEAWRDGAEGATLPVSGAATRHPDA